MLINLTSTGSPVVGANLTMTLLSMKQGKLSVLLNTTGADGTRTVGVTTPSTQGDYAYIIQAQDAGEKAMAELPFRVTGLDAVVVIQDTSGNFNNIFTNSSTAVLNVSLVEGGSPANGTISLSISDASNLQIYSNSSMDVIGSMAMNYTMAGLDGWYYVEVKDANSNPLGSAAFEVI